ASHASIAAAFASRLGALPRDEPAYLPGLTVTCMQLGGLSGTRRNAPAVVRELIRLHRRHVGGVPWVLLWWLAKAWVKAGLHRLGGDRLALPVTNLYRRGRRGPTPPRFLKKLQYIPHNRPPVPDPWGGVKRGPEIFPR